MPEGDADTFDFDTHWISAHCESGIFGIDNPVLTGVIKFGLVWDLTSLAYVVTQWQHLTLPFLFASALVLLWVNFAPALIWYYDERVMPRFFDQFRDLCSDPEQVTDVAAEANRFFAKPRVLVSIFWAIGILLVAWAGTPLLRQRGMAGDGQLFLWLTYGYAIYLGGILAGPGFVGPITTIRTVRRLVELDFDIQPLHPDRLGGLSTVGYYAIRTTLLFSSASLFLPLAFRLAAGTGRGAVILSVVLVYLLTIVASFAYPTFKVNRKAASLRDEILENLQQRTFALRAQIEADSDDELADLNRQMELQRIRSTYEDYDNVQLYPMQIDILLRLAGSVLLPLVFLFLEIWVSDLF
ncbi:hypothetical protein [Haloplanus aerogenes]|uniref:Uncharacterized protein n=1 Tax=Haloplanus aerogenes TaxID=660522 RepID=A0A3M0CXN8_9EURY|nr:hypothetical protein [Haloplanus aerogenes]AZH25175.1 hypothetical protein DU502_07190 [Haloplanus aerogenes]RMB13597.1 hypothetical protein ATH50_2036 [Haloplanus aerogenes]